MVFEATHHYQASSTPIRRPAAWWDVNEIATLSIMQSTRWRNSLRISLALGSIFRCLWVQSRFNISHPRYRFTHESNYMWARKTATEVLSYLGSPWRTLRTRLFLIFLFAVFAVILLLFESPFTWVKRGERKDNVRERCHCCRGTRTPMAYQSNTQARLRIRLFSFTIALGGRSNLRRSSVSA